MKKAFSIILSLLFLISSSALLVKAAVTTGESTMPSAGTSGITIDEQKMIAPADYIAPVNSRVMPFAGQNHNYSLVLRGNGEAIVTLRVALTNVNTDSSLSEVELRIPKIAEPKDLSAYQIIANPPCIRYEDVPVVQYPYNPKCAEYGDPDYYYYYGGGKYQKAEAEFSGDTLKVTLPNAIEPNKSGSFFVYFRGFGYTKKDVFGAYKYNFESLAVDDQINELRLGISTDSDLFLKGVKGSVNYRNEASTALKAMPAADAGAVANTSLDRFVSQIGQGVIIKNASNLASMETYKIDGAYADSRVKLYANQIALTVGITLAILVVVVLIAMFIYKKFKKTETPKDKESEKTESMPSSSEHMFLITLGSSFISATISSVFGAILVFCLFLLDSYYYGETVFIKFAIVILGLFNYMISVLAPGLFLGYKKGLKWGVLASVLTIVWIFVFLVTGIILIFLIASGQRIYNPPNLY